MLKKEKTIIKTIFFLSLAIIIGLFSASFTMGVKFQDAPFVAPPSADKLVNPLKGDAAATEAGRKIYTVQCSVCHGLKGLGDGVAAAGLSKPPANHSAEYVQRLSDGALFWMITNGRNPMPAYKDIFTDNQRWELVNYIRTLAKPVKK